MNKKDFKNMIDFQKIVFEKIPETNNDVRIDKCIKNVKDTLVLAEKYIDQFSDAERECVARLLRWDLFEAVNSFYDKKSNTFSVGEHLKYYDHVEIVVQQMKDGKNADKMKGTIVDSKSLEKANNNYKVAIDEYTLYPTEKNKMQIISLQKQIDDLLANFLDDLIVSDSKHFN